MEIFKLEDGDQRIHTEINEFDGGKEYFHIVTRRSNGRYNSNSLSGGRRGRRRGRKPKVRNEEEKVTTVPRIGARQTPALMVNERERRKTSDRFNTFLEVLKGEKEFYIDNEDADERSKNAGYRKQDLVESIPTHHIFADGHLSVLTESIDDLSEKTCVITVKENCGVDGVENSLLASIEDGSTNALNNVVQEILNLPSTESAQIISGIEQFGEKSEVLMNVMKDDDILKSEVSAYIDLKDLDFDIGEQFLEITNETNTKTFHVSEPSEESNNQKQHMNYEKNSIKFNDGKSKSDLPDDTFPKVKSITLSNEDKKFRCKLCSTTFSTYGDARRHAKSFHSTTVFEATTNKRHDERFFKCPECERRFPTEKGRNKHHLLMHLKNKPVNCPECSQLFNSFKPLERHLKEIHDKNAVHFCDVCEEEFVLGASLEHHISISHPSNSKFNMLDYYSKQIITPKRIIHCPLCDERLIGAKAFRNHHEKVHNGEAFKCKQCKFKTYSTSVLKRHLATVHKAIDLSLYSCVHCKIGYQMPQDLEEHYIYVHNKQPSNLCQYCGEKFACLEMLRFHKGKHRAFPCDFCPLAFMKPEALDEHLNKVHKNDLSKEADTLFDIQPSTSSSNELVETLINETDTFLSSPEKDFSSKILEINHDGSVQVKNEPSTVSESEDEIENEIVTSSENKVHMLHHTKEGDLKEMDANDPLKGFRIKDLPKKLNCPTCGKLLTTKFLRTHMRSHEGSLPHKCTKCSKAYAQGTLLRKHMKNRHYEDFLKLGNKMPKKKKVQCEYCDLIFEDIYLLEEHLWTHLNEKTYKCETCRIKFGMKVNWMEHYKTHYFKEEKKCPNCDRMFKSVGFYREHTERCLSNWTCEECGFKCDSPEIYRKHKRMEHSSGASLFKCPHCNKPFYSKYAYEDHLITHSSLKQYLCQYCNKEFKRKRPLTEHIARIHGSKKHVCTHCSLSFEYAHELQLHSKEHRRQQMSCSECGVIYLSRQTLDNHIAVHHSVLDHDPFICAICFEVFERQIDLKLHLPKHTPDSPYICQVHRCHKMFRKEVLLRSHMARRHSYLEYFCHYCDRKFILDSDLRKHIAIHKENSEYKCSKCEFKCPTKLELHYHTCSNSGGEEPHYECRICGMKSFRKDNTISHVQTLHNQTNPLDYIYVNKWKCSVCEKMFNSQSSINKHLEQHSVHGVIAPGTLIKSSLSSSFEFKSLDENSLLTPITLKLEELLSLLKVDVIAQSATDESGDLINLRTTSWHCSACSFISETEIGMKTHLISSTACLQKLEQILLPKTSENQIELKIYDPKTENQIEYQPENSNLQYLLVENNLPNETPDDPKEPVLLMDNNLQLVFDSEAGLSNLFTQSSEVTNLPIFEIPDDDAQINPKEDEYDQEFPVEVSPDLLASSGVLIQMEDGRLVIPEIGTGNGVQYQLVKEETDNQGTTESTYEILESAVSNSDSPFIDESQTFILA